MKQPTSRRSESAYTHQLGSLWNVAQVAELLDLSVHRVYQLAKLGTIPSIRVGRTLRFDPDTITTWLRAGGSLALNSPAATSTITPGSDADEQQGDE